MSRSAVVRVRAHPLSRIVLSALGAGWALFVVTVFGTALFFPDWLEDEGDPEPLGTEALSAGQDLGLLAVLALSVVLATMVAVRTPRSGVDVGTDRVTVHGFWRDRTVPRVAVLGVEGQGWLWPWLHWEDEAQRHRRTPLSTFGTSAGALWFLNEDQERKLLQLQELLGGVEPDEVSGER
ncbi:MAG: hypothetical protein LBE25_14770 [Arthrobacter sp.]|jgi:hypothetical protein|nr:hypothetical protein [Arthrobacter sp.]